MKTLLVLALCLMAGLTVAKPQSKPATRADLQAGLESIYEQSYKNGFNDGVRAGICTTLHEMTHKAKPWPESAAICRLSDWNSDFIPHPPKLPVKP